MPPSAMNLSILKPGIFILDIQASSGRYGQILNTDMLSTEESQENRVSESRLTYTSQPSMSLDTVNVSRHQPLINLIRR